MPLAPDSLEAIASVFSDLERRAAAWFASEAITAADRRIHRSIDMRYRGQNYELSIPVPEGRAGTALLDTLRSGFEEAHQQMYGYIATEEPVQAVTFRIEAIGAVPQADIRRQEQTAASVDSAIAGRRDVWLAETASFVPCPVYDRAALGAGHCISGPAIIEQMDATTLVLPGQSARVDPFLNIIIEG
jgi:N-methylhydantoinase A